MQKQKQNIKLDIRTNKLMQKRKEKPTPFRIWAPFIAMVSQIILLSLMKIIFFFTFFSTLP